MQMNYQLDLGKSPVKVTSRDTLLWLMRGIIAEAAGKMTRQDAVKLWRERVAEHPDRELLMDQMEEHYALLLFQRCVAPADNGRDKSEKLRKNIRNTIASQVVLSTWVVPGVGKQLIECTFGEIAETASFTSRFLAKLATQGAPGSKVKEVFADENALQEYWTQVQLL